ncbi:GT4 family glycosyltransferase PelF [Vibrio sp. PP-XX7]
MKETRQRQLRDGAPATRTQVIPNGIHLERFASAYAERSDHIPLVVGLIGRVVPIKDIKTFIRAIKETQYRLPGIEGWIIGPTEEDPDYVHECQLLVESLELQQHVKFLGMQNVVEMLPQLGLVALTSISEAQPLVLLEAMAAGVPVLASDVGSCREIIEGVTDEDRSLGNAGYVVPIASPGATAQAIIDILQDPIHWQQRQAVGLQRVQRFYDEKLMFTRYQHIYEDTILWPE